MKNMVLFFLILFTIILKAQNNFDVIVKHSGERISAKVHSIDEKITFSYPNESVVNSLSRNCIKEIIFSSGRVEKVSEKVIISGEDDWEKVVITTNVDDVKCLVRKGDITVTANNAWNFKSKAGVDQKATMKFKKEAAVLKAHVILVQDQHKETTYWSGSASTKSGVAYGYQ